MNRFASMLAIGLFALPLAFASSAALAETDVKPTPTATEAHQERATGLPSGLLSNPVAITANQTV